MKRTLEVSARKVDDAIKEGLKKLGVSMGDENVDIKILSQGGLFKKAKVLFIVGKDDEPVAAVEKSDKAERTETRYFERETKSAESKNEVFQKSDDKKSFHNKHDKKERPSNAQSQSNHEVKPVNDTAVNDFKSKDRVQQKPAITAPAVRIENTNTGNSNQQRDNRQNSKFDKHKYNNKREFDSENRKDTANQGAKNENQSIDKKKFEKKHEDRPIVSAPPSDEHITRCKNFITNVLNLTGIEGEVNTAVENGINVVIETTDSTIIGYRGEMLDSIQYLSGLIVNGSDNKRIRVGVDAMDYRQRRIETLIKLANKMADKAINNKRKVSLEPMNSAERRIIHAALSENNSVITRSEGHEPSRRIVILPKR